MPHRILVIEPNKALREIIASTLKKDGYSVHAAEDIYFGIRHTEDLALDLAIASAENPQATGTIQSLRHVHPQLKIILTGAFNTDESVEQKHRPAGCVYLKKPFVLSELVRVVRAQLSAE